MTNEVREGIRDKAIRKEKVQTNRKNKAALKVRLSPVGGEV
jgi:hypothetical protein